MTLKNTLQAMLSQAGRKSGEPVRMTDETLVDLQLTREKTYPSDREWMTVLGQWPYKFRVTKEPKKLKDTNFHLKGQVMVIPVFVD